MSLAELVKEKNVIGIVCNQWGDTGKGKLVDTLAENWADIIARGTGGANAGHTIVNGKEEFIFHLVPSGILHDGRGKVNIIGEGVVLDPLTLIDELNELEKHHYSYKNLLISHEAKIVMPYHLLLDRAKESKKGSGKIGTTGRGIGPAYEDHVARRGIIVNDLFNPEQFQSKLKRNLSTVKNQLKAMEVDAQVVKEIMHHPMLGSGKFYDAENLFNEDALIQTYVEVVGTKFKPLVTDTRTYLRNALGNKKILLEGAQGLLLSIDYGTKPYVTSSDPSMHGLAKGVGLNEWDVDLTIGIAKAYMTRVGNGPFPTEMGGKESETHCDNHSNNKEYEKQAFAEANMNHSNALMQGIGFRVAGGEYGATTKRPRRTGWLDLVALKYAMQFNGRCLFLTKVDILDGCDEIKLCTHYTYEGKPYYYAGKMIQTGEVLNEFPCDSVILNQVKPHYYIQKGWKRSTIECKTLEELPSELKQMTAFIETQTQGTVCGISNGAAREQIIFFSPSPRAERKIDSLLAQ